jgi:hypothetical protein
LFCTPFAVQGLPADFLGTGPHAPYPAPMTLSVAETPWLAFVAIIASGDGEPKQWRPSLDSSIDTLVD